MKKSYVYLLLCCLLSLSAWSQDNVIRGVVTDQAGVPLPGASIVEKGTSNGVVSDFDGQFNLTPSKNQIILEISYVGYKHMEISARSGSFQEITMEEDASELDEVVVTALNITREEKSLGYAVAKVEGDEVTKSVSGNWMNGMSGKVPGLFFAQAGSGPSGSIRVTLRGDQSLNYGGNEALIVVDGVPISSGMTATRAVSNYAQADAPVDFGDGLSDINPEDIESVSVLKGPAAAALYGSRAANGAIMITTKSGKKGKGLGITINTTVSFEQAGFFPDFQTEYGNGSDMGEQPYSLWELTADMAPDGVATNRNYSRYTFGERFDPNKMRYLYASKNWETGTFSKLPWVYQDDWYTGLFRTGVTTINTVSINGNNGEGTSSRLSITDFKNDWIMPNTGFNRQSASLAFNTPINDWISLNSKVNYYRKRSDNMPGGGYDESNPMYALIWGFNVNSIDDWKNEYFDGRYNFVNWSAQGENGQGLVFPSANSYNPYRTLYEALSAHDKNRVFGNIGLNFDLGNGFSLDLRSGLDWSTEFRTQRRPFYTTDYPNGFYREQTVRYLENNNDFMFRYENNDMADGRFTLSAFVGGNNRVNEYYNSRITLEQLGEEGIYHTTNLPTGVNPDNYNYRSKKVVNSFYGMLSLGWDDTYFLDVTARNDWSSTLSPGNWSFFYPSVAASVLVDKVLDFQTNAPWIDFTKLRFSWANVGNDTGAYSLTQPYGNTSFPGGYVLPGTIRNPLIKPENIESWEVGLEAKFFKNRLSFDITKYYSSTTDQIVSVNVDQITGATGRIINAGEITNEGIEIAAGFVPIRTKDFEWSFDANWSKNNNTLVSLQEGWDPEEPLQTDMGTTIGGRVYVYSYLGGEMHNIYGRGFQRAPEGATYIDENGETVDASGMHIVNSQGYPVLDESPDREIAKVNPDWRGGMTQRFRYKNLSLSASFSAQMGGSAFSVTNFALSYQGKLKNSLEGRYDGLVHEGVNVVENTDGTVTYTKNTTVTENIQTYYNAYIWNRNNTEMNTFSTDFLKLRELRLDYQMPRKIMESTGIFQDMSFGIFATNVFCWTDFPQYDPETGMLNGSNIMMGIESVTFPMTRTYGLNVKLSF
ncbi:SusC/RagA family TonB-linked outer membrane protein [Flagellimonas taeanensis]|uniref:SusC/RagA family TonB-linked outer membrane protein n=1 Tax=Flavobacteriaceae TaxID=49546 RepID=UPI000E6911B0|nr:MULTISPECIES: SusC/RagA family TonB-linked outer membrane protein [Allomuricauda]MDC6386396.1 SusC/RagA family TonB-linked outer membrane protein [Muricauda sp. SK9]RIV51981.1 SusC/RagA family TonB-linked outer membrane protein [Allomuricauda taeanensis]